MAFDEILKFSLYKRSTVTLQQISWRSATAAWLVFVLLALIKWAYLRKTMPPGPLGIPCIGCRHELPAEKPWRKFAEWNRSYGVFSQKFVCLIRCGLNVSYQVQLYPSSLDLRQLLVGILRAMRMSANYFMYSPGYGSGCLGLVGKAIRDLL